MLRVILAILLVVSTCAVVAHGFLAYQYNSPQTLIAEEEAPDEKPADKEVKDLSKDKILFSISNDKALAAALLRSARSHDRCYYSKGFCDAPYNPPESC